ncbi:MAG: hypothetical protein FJZ00_10985 [Candidatus Sericytochromatia bacterium]|uniref:SMP-30/Gluconolactonase/LRE-like region domain-containing protein n=1 Tax=Candidatus Tanganyikabacteria bacterium TaxID=2961651 RepID=A0A937X7P5_9BACT|nr:hypothetical protein [Candidatus Tanganyikabacteria bacterium]
MSSAVILGNVSTIAGSSQGYAEGVGANAQLASPIAVVSDGQGNVYFSDLANHKIRKVVAATRQTSLVAGSSQGYAEGVGAAAQFNQPTGLALDGAGNLYVAEALGHRIRKIVLATGQTSLVAGSVGGYQEGVGPAAQFALPAGVAIDGLGSLYVVENSNNRVRRINLATGLTSLVAGSGGAGAADGSGIAASFNGPELAYFDTATNTLFVADRGNVRIRAVK